MIQNQLIKDRSASRLKELGETYSGSRVYMHEPDLLNLTSPSGNFVYAINGDVCMKHSSTSCFSLALLVTSRKRAINIGKFRLRQFTCE